jgi:hypothetical protein
MTCAPQPRRWVTVVGIGVVLAAALACHTPRRPTPPPTPPPIVEPPAPPVEVDPHPEPLIRPDAVIRGVGASDYASLGDPRVNLGDFAHALGDLGLRHTRVWLIDAWAMGKTNEPGTYVGYVPVRWNPAADAWDLNDWDPAYFDRLREYADQMNRHGIVPVFTLLELYAWSAEKQGLLWVPNQDFSFLRRNIQGIRWGHPDDRTFGAPPYEGEGLPDDWLRTFTIRVLDALGPASYVIELGNEMKEKPMHVRLAQMLRTHGYGGPIQVNRNEETPGQWRNMMVNTPGFDYLAIHGKDDLGYLDEVWPASQSTEPTYREMWRIADASRIVLSSDGARKSVNVDDAYDYPRLTAVFLDALARGAAVEHQLSVKLRRFTHADLQWAADLAAYDAPMLRELVAAAR